jgi:hypothetical protein
MKTVLVIIALCSVALYLTAAQVYAERSTVEVPFAFHGNSCTFDELNVVYTCTWQGSSETVTSEWKTSDGVIPPEQLAKESKEAHEEAVVVAEKEEEKLNPTQKLIAQLKEDIKSETISSADLILYELLVDLQTSCELGIEHGALIQQYNQFELPTSDPRTAYKAIDFSKNVKLGNIIKKIEECKGWDKYRVDVLGQRYLDIEVDDSTSQINHSNNRIALNTTPQPTQKLTDQSFLDSKQQAEDYICRASFYDAQYKKEQGCSNVAVEQYEPIIDRTISSSIPMRNYVEYMSAGTVDVETLKKTEVIRAQQQSLETFALLHGIDLADLKNLVQGEQP